MIATKGQSFLTAHPTISKSTDTTSTQSVAHQGSFTVVDSVTRDSNGHVTKINTKTVSLQNPQSLTVGSKTYDGSAAITIDASDLGLDSALKYHGVTTTALTDGATTNPIVINGANHTATTGCVVFYSTKEFVFDGAKWNELGDGSNHKIKQDAVSSPSASGSTTAFIDTISQDANGKITATKKNVSFPTIPTSFNITANATDDDVVILTGSGGANSVTYDAKHAQKGPSSGYTSGNTTTSISGSGGSGTIKIPQITVDKYGHVTAAADESVTITMPTLPTKVSDLTDDVVAGNYLPLSGGTLTGTLTSQNIVPSTSHTSSVTGYSLGTSTKQFNTVYTRYIDTTSGFNLRLKSGGVEHINFYGGNINITGNVSPVSNNTYSLGTDNYQWKDVYSKDLHAENSVQVGNCTIQYNSTTGCLEIIT